VFVTGSLGGAALDRLRAERGRRAPRHRALPRLAAGLALARLRGAGACIDVSDGLAADLRHLLAASGVGARIDAAAVPRPRGFAAACARAGVDPDALALGGGEDYELLFTLRPGAASARVLARRLGVPVTEIGRIEVGRRLRFEPGPGRAASGAAGWRHF
jgi:thiamine-monophosphate kinase